MYLTDTVVSDENRDLNNHSDGQQVKRERSSEVHYNGGDASLYSNVSVSVFLSISVPVLNLWGTYYVEAIMTGNIFRLF